MDNRTLQKITDETFLPQLLDHVTQGGALPNLCELMQINYSRVIEWIYKDPLRSQSYERALQARAEWFIQSILNELKDIALADVRLAYNKDGSLLPPNEWPPSLARVVSAVESEELFDGQGDNRVQIGYTKRLKLWDKLRALELLGKNLRMFKEQVEHTGTLSLEELVLGSMKIEAVSTKEEQCLTLSEQQITSPPKEIHPAAPLKELDSLSSGKTVPSDEAPTA